MFYNLLHKFQVRSFHVIGQRIYYLWFCLETTSILWLSIKALHRILFLKSVGIFWKNAGTTDTLITATKGLFVLLMLKFSIWKLHLRNSHNIGEMKMYISCCSLLEKTRRRNLNPSQDQRLPRKDLHHKKMKLWRFTVKSRECLEVRKERYQVESFMPSTIMSNTPEKESSSGRKF